MKIKVPFPKNLKKEDKFLFEGRQDYTVTSTKIKKINNVFITHEGLCLKNGFLVKNSHFNLSGKEDLTFYFDFWKLALEQYLVSSFGKSLVKQKLNDGNYLHVYTKWFGYFFWLTDILPKLIKTRNFHKEVKLIYPQAWENISFINETLSLFPHLKHEIIPSGNHLQVDNLLLPETRKWSNAIDPSELKTVREFMFEQLKACQIDINLGERIFISRNKALRRKPVNNDALEKFVTEKGFTSVYMEDYSFLEQISIMKNAKLVMSLHGAGLANTMFIKNNGAIIELSPKIKDKKLFRLPFWRLANAVEAKFFIQFCEYEEKDTSDLYNNDIFVDLKELEIVVDNLNNF